MRALLLLVAGFAAGLATGWALWPADGGARAPRRAPAAAQGPAAREAPVSARPAAPESTSASDRVADLYRERTRKHVDPRLLEILVEEVRRMHERNIEAAVARATEYERMRDLYGEIPTGSMLLQARNGTATPMPREPHRVQKVPLNLGVAGRGREAYVNGGGVIPLGKVLVVEQAVVDARFEFQPRGNRGSLTLRLDRSLRWRNVAAGFRGAFRGRALFRQGQERNLRLEVRGGVASLELEGRIVTLAEAEELLSVPFRWVPEGSRGFLTGGSILLQVVADHGGGNPRRVSIDGGHNGRFDARELRNIWDEAVALGELRKSLVHYDGIGLIPPGKVFMLRRVEYRGRLNPAKGSHSDFIIRASGRELFKTNAKIDPRPQGVWQGTVKVHAGREATVSLELSYFGIGEARFFGDLMDK